MAWFRRSIRRRPDGDYDVRLGTTERDLLRTWAEDLRGLLDDDEHRPALRRLSPPAYGDDVVRDAEYQAFMGSDLQASRRAALELLMSTADASVIDEAQAMAWLQAINAVRLVLGTHLDVHEDDPLLRPRGPDSGLHAAYHVLSALLDELVAALDAAN
jgi:hypothetical protein